MNLNDVAHMRQQDCPVWPTRGRQRPKPGSCQDRRGAWQVSGEVKVTDRRDGSAVLAVIGVGYSRLWIPGPRNAEGGPYRSAILVYGAKGQTRTADRTIFSRELYQLSYLGGCSAKMEFSATGGR